MKRSDVKPGVVYAVRNYSTSVPAMVVFLSGSKDTRLWKISRAFAEDAPRFAEALGYSRSQVGHGAYSTTVGWPTAEVYGGNGTREQRAAALLSLTMDDFISSTTSYMGVLVDGDNVVQFKGTAQQAAKMAATAPSCIAGLSVIQLQLAVQPVMGKIVGLYDDVAAEHEAERERRRQQAIAMQEHKDETRRDEEMLTDVLRGCGLASASVAISTGYASGLCAVIRLDLAEARELVTRLSQEHKS
jgi:hypothetical protein